jgi:hypothetical protein
VNLVLERSQLKQRADYTHKYNTKTGRHGWLRLTPAYSLKIVDELVVNHDKAKRIFDPFCGTGTTALSAAYHGHEGVTTDINPFLVWLAQAKLAHYSTATIASTNKACAEALDLVERKAIVAVSAPPIFNIERWWSARTLEFLTLLKAAIATTTAVGSAERSLLLVAFCRTLIEQSNAAFNHQSMGFKADAQTPLEFEVDLPLAYSKDVQFVTAGAAENPSGTGQIVFGDARWPDRAVEGPFDLVITSPPYANRMSYIRELRPYMYWLGFLENARAAGDLDWTAIGGTWGIATSRLTGWERDAGHFKSEHLSTALFQIAHADNKNGALLGNYVAKYFDDMWSHFQGLTKILAPGAELHYIVGNSTFYGCLVSTEKLYAEMLLQLGFKNVECRAIRKRNSKKELIEFDVVATWR